MKALITGAGGFIGSNLVQKLQKDGWELNLLLQHNTNLNYKTHDTTHIYRGDIRKREDIHKAISGVDVVFNLAAILPHHKATENEYQMVNTGGVRNILFYVEKMKIKRFVQVSTVGIFDDPPSYYSLSKKRAEEILFKAYRERKTPIVIVRPTIAYGPGDMRPGFLNLMRMIKKGLTVFVGDGNNFFHTVYVGNLVDGLVKAATAEKAIGQDFIIGDDPCPKMKDIVFLMEKIIGKKNIPLSIPLPLARLLGYSFDILKRIKIPSLLNSQRVRFLSEDKKYNIQKAVELLQWHPKIKLEEGLLKTYQWYVKEKLI